MGERGQERMHRQRKVQRRVYDQREEEGKDDGDGDRSQRPVHQGHCQSAVGEGQNEIHPEPADIGHPQKKENEITETGALSADKPVWPDLFQLGHQSRDRKLKGKDQSESPGQVHHQGHFRKKDGQDTGPGHRDRRHEDL